MTAGGAYIKLAGGKFEMGASGGCTIKAGKHVYVGPASLSPVLPAFSRSPFPDKEPLRFDLALRDIPGPHGAPLPNTEWWIVQAVDQAAALVTSESVLKGISDDDGRVKLSDADQKTLHARYNESPNGIWLIFNSHARNLVIRKERADWQDHNRMQHALDAMGYSDDIGMVDEGVLSDPLRSRAKAELRAAKGGAMLKKLKGDGK